MSVLGGVLIGLGIVMIVLGFHFLRTHFTRLAPNEQLRWVGFGDNPFKKK